MQKHLVFTELGTLSIRLSVHLLDKYSLSPDCLSTEDPGANNAEATPDLTELTSHPGWKKSQCFVSIYNIPGTLDMVFLRVTTQGWFDRLTF